MGGKTLKLVHSWKKIVIVIFTTIILSKCEFPILCIIPFQEIAQHEEGKLHIHSTCISIADYDVSLTYSKLC